MITLEIIKKLCEQNGMSIAQLEKELGYGNGSLSKSKTLKSDRLLEIAKKFHVSLEYLVTGETENVSEESPEKKDVADQLQRLLNALNHDPANLTFDGKPLDDKGAAILTLCLNNSLQLAKIHFALDIGRLSPYKFY